MKLRLQDLVGSLSVDCSLDLSDQVRDAAGSLLVGPLQLTGVARHGDKGVDLEARIQGTLRLNCSRCLEPFESPLIQEFELTLVGEAVEWGKEDIVLSDADANLFYATDGVADLHEVAAEQVHLNLPTKAVCRPECRGLCSTCGENRNRIECGCQEAELDPRLDSLRELREHLRRGDAE